MAAETDSIPIAEASHGVADGTADSVASGARTPSAIGPDQPGEVPGPTPTAQGAARSALDALLGDLARVTEPAIVSALEAAVRGRRWRAAEKLAAELARREAAREGEADAVVAAVLGVTPMTRLLG